MKKLLALSVSCLFLAACGKEPSSSTPSPEEVIPTNLSSRLIPLIKQDQDCTKTPVEENEFNLNLFLDGATLVEPRNFQGLFESNLVRNSKVVSTSHYEQKILMTQTQKGVSIKITSFGKDIDLCPQGEDYARDTIEGAALNASHFINKTHKTVALALPNLKLPPIKLNIGTKITHISTYRTHKGLEEFTRYMTDNAFYFPIDHTITFLPHSLEGRENGIDVNFWEVPTVAAHEYGHHIFMSLLDPKVAASMDAYSKCFNTKFSEDIRTTAKEQEKTPRRVGPMNVMGALNEGFADLMAHYSLDKKEAGLKGVKCLEMSREVESNKFADGTLKAFDQVALRSFFSKEVEFKATCMETDFQDGHILGAIFAHNADLFLSLVTQSKEEKIQILASWARDLGQQLVRWSSSGPEIYLQEALKSFLLISLKKNNKKFDQVSCAVVKRMYPGLEKKFVECFN